MQPGNLNQFNAIRHGEGPALIYAGPGTGKTYTVTHHILFLIEDLHVDPDRILVITFTKEAAAEMRDRFVKINPSAGAKVHFGTFHSIYYKILRAYGNCTLNIANDNAKRAAALLLAGEEGREDFLSNISAHKAGRDLSELIPDEKEREAFRANETMYNDIMAQKKLMDYDDILIKCRELLCSNEEVRRRVSLRFDHVLADEFQDINDVQYEILKLIRGENRNIYAVGDEKQSIYGFRGSKPGIFEAFMKDFPEAKGYRLDINYRNHEKILSAASKVIGDSEYTLATNVKAGGGLFLQVYEKKEEEHAAFLKDLDSALERGLSVTVLARTNRDIAGLQDMCDGVLKAHGVVTSKKDDQGGRVRLYDGILALLEFIGKKDRKSLLKWLDLREDNIPRSLFPDEKVDLIQVMERIRGTEIAERLKTIDRELTLLSKVSAPSFVTYLKNVVFKDRPLGEGDMEELTAIEEESMRLRSKDELKGLLFEKREALIKESAVKHDRARENPAFLTFHASKGLEYDAVFIVDVVEGKIPRRSKFTDKDPEEERRLFYVGMTRARNELYIYTLKKEGACNMLPSRFLKEIM